MKWSLNLYRDEQYPANIVAKAILNKNPIVFVVPKELETENIFDFINETRELRKSFCIMEYCDITTSTAYLVSFEKIRRKKVMFVAPYYCQEEALQMIKDINKIINKVFPKEKQRVKLRIRMQPN